MPARDGGAEGGASQGGASSGGRASWRRAGKSAGDAPQRRWQQDWTRRGHQQHQARVVGRRLKIAGWSLLAVGLIGAIVWVVLFFPKKAPLVVQVVTDYADALPANTWAADDLDTLATLDNRNVSLGDLSAQWTSKERGREALRHRLAATRPGGPKNDVIVVYLSMHGFVDADGTPCLLTGDASPLDSATWLPVAELLGDIRSQLSDKVKKLIVLDAARFETDWSAGQLVNDFAGRLQAIVDNAKIPNVYILNSAGPGQRGWTSPQLAGSVFGSYFTRGLRGGGDRNDNGRVSVRELHDYLKRHVRGWTLANRFDVQEPMLIVSPGSADDFDVAWSVSGEPALAAASNTSDDLRNALDKLWTRHEAIASNSPQRDEPLLWNAFQHKLLRMEQVLDGGKAYRGEATRVRDELDRLAGLLEQGRRPDQLTPHSLPMRAHLLGGAAQSSADRAAMRAVLDDPKIKPPADAKWPYLSRAEVAWTWLLENPSQEKLRQALQFGGPVEPAGGAGLIELHYARMLDRWLDAELWKGDAAPIGRSLRLRAVAERAAAPLDMRVDNAVRLLVDRADQRRRLAEDQLFVGSREALEQFAATAADAENQFRAAQAVTDELTQAWRLVDQAEAELPYLAQWLLRRPAPGKPVFSASEARSISELSQRVATLRGLLTSPEAQRNAIDEIKTQRTAAAERFNQFRKLYDDECYRLRFEAGDDVLTAHDTTGVLAVPLVSGEARNKLRSRLRDVTETLHAAYSDTADHDASQQVTDAGNAWHEMLSSLPVHPALSMLLAARSQNAKQSGEQGFNLSQAGQQVRNLLATAAPDVQAALKQAANAAIDVPKDGDERDSLVAADALARACAPLSYQLDGTDAAHDATHVLRRYNLRHLLLWQATRTAEDLWGPAQANQGSFFAVAAGDDCDAADRVYRSVRELETPAAQRLGECFDAVKAGLSPVCKPETLMVVDASQSLPQTASIHAPKKIPVGQAALWLRDSAGQPLSVSIPDGDGTVAQRRLALSVDPAQQDLGVAHRDYRIAGQQLVNRTNDLQLVALYRGHEFTTNVPVLAEKGIEFVYVRPESENPRITVHGHATRASAITFVLDCSGSMSTPVGDGRERRTRLDIARTALQAILDDLAKSRAYHVAVRVYGHRAGWDPQQLSKVKYSRYGEEQRQKTIAAGQVFELHPSNDVELVLPMGAFGNDEDARVKNVLNRLWPTGETPLYLAIIEAIENDFTNERDAAQRRVVVITDGVNEQSPGGPAGVIKLRGHVERALDSHREQPVEVDIIGFNVDAPAQREKLDDLKEIARRSRGTYYPASDPSELLQALQDSLGPRKYSVENAQGVLVGEPRDLEEPTDLPGPQQYIVRLVDAQPPVESEPQIVEQSEALELFLSDDGRRFEDRRYDAALRDSVNKRPDPADRDHFCFFGAHLPEWSGNGARFPISIQNADETRFSRRPAEAWFEIKPVSTRPPQDYPGYSFYDFDYEPERPVPVASCLAPQWPTKADKAEIRVWAKFQPTRPDEVRRLPDAVRSGAAGFRLKTLPDVLLTVERQRGKSAQDGGRVTVTEEYPPGTAMPLMKIALDPPPRRTVHTYYPQSARIRHEFTYAAGDVDDVDQVQLRFTRRELLLDQAVSTPKPLIVTVPDPLLRK